MNDLLFREKDHVYMLDGERLPCVSDLCRFISRDIYKETPVWMMDAAAERGTAVHKATEELDRTNGVRVDDEYAPYVQAYAKFLQEHDVVWELSEHSLWHPQHRYAGTIDRYGTVDGLKTLVDLKTTYRVHKPLCTASLNLYRMLLEARGRAVERLMILHLKKDGTYSLVTISIDNAVPMALLTLDTALRKRRKRGKKT
jgi:hypothetical protein